MKKIDYEVLGGRKMTLALLILAATVGLAAFGKFTMDVAGVFATVYGGYSYANQRITTAELSRSDGGAP